MPFTPFHFGPGAALHALAPQRFSFLAFCAGNVLVDVEPGYYLLTGQFPLHRFWHTVPGALLAGAAVVALWALMRRGRRCLPDVAGWKVLTLGPVVAGALAGVLSHVALDAVMHADMQPWAPFSTANPWLGAVPVGALHLGCVVAGVAGAAVVGWRRLRHWQQQRACRR
ncbi:metal-dependent hydrolase [Ideonella livida]|uniref:DUF4184 family protein n=1 Tax=Ideonella livida TaxID=2707176 RepID=A0A7C9TLR4_9BURK|nr:metal-dependent hydrolase [Ideonella livida]NDY92443.1 hypothetical protein [Ideonella livida]